MESVENKIDQSNLSPDQQRLVRETLDAILASTHFKRSKRYPALLEYAVRNKLEGNLDVLNERTVAMEVFDRKANYDPSTDSVVRMAASEVRKRLALYFSVNPSAPVRIELPVGSYSPNFNFIEQPRPEGVQAHQRNGELKSDSVRNSGLPGAKPPRIPWLWTVSIAAIAAAAVPLIIWCATLLNSARPVEMFWAPLEKSHATVLISLGETSRPNPPQWAVDLPENAMAIYMQTLSNRPISDITAANLISQHLANHGGRSEIRMASSTNFADLHQSPAVLLGAGQASPWTMTLGANLRYRFTASDGGAVHFITDNNNPANRQWKVDLRLPYDHVENDYALVTRQLNPTTGQWWVGIGGSTTLSTPEAVRMLLDPVAMKKVAAQLPRGWEKKNLQFVIEFALVKGTCGSTRIVGTNVW